MQPGSQSGRVRPASRSNDFCNWTRGWHSTWPEYRASTIPARFSISDEKALHMRLHSLRVLVPRGDLSIKFLLSMRLVYRARAVLSSGCSILFFVYFVIFLSTSLLLHETRRAFFVTKQDCEVRFIILAQKLAENSLGGFVVETETGQYVIIGTWQR